VLTSHAELDAAEALIDWLRDNQSDETRMQAAVALKSWRL
jgi:hypothetical protein